MSGGHFNYEQYSIGTIGESIESVVLQNDDTTLDEYDQAKGYGFSKETIQKLKEGVHYLKLAFIYAQRIDWLLSGDDGEETFHARLAKDLAKKEE
jgi:hypothetical protein